LRTVRRRLTRAGGNFATGLRNARGVSDEYIFTRGVGV
jgi:hypothetical protein